MSRRDFLMFLAKDGLPDGYTKVDYLQSTGTQWIDMGIAPDQNTKVVLKVLATNLNGGAGVSLVGSRSSNNSSDQFFTYLSADQGFLFRVDGMKSAIAFNKYKANTLYTITLSSSEASFVLENGFVDNEYKFSSSDFTSTVSMTLFKAKPFNMGFIGRIYYCKHYNNNGIIQHLIPCLDFDGIPCMYDLISKTTFYNQGSGSFTWG